MFVIRLADQLKLLDIFREPSSPPPPPLLSVSVLHNPHREVKRVGSSELALAMALASLAYGNPSHRQANRVNKERVRERESIKNFHCVRRRRCVSAIVINGEKEMSIHKLQNKTNMHTNTQSTIHRTTPLTLGIDCHQQTPPHQLLQPIQYIRQLLLQSRIRLEVIRWSVKQRKYLRRKDALTKIRTLHLWSKSHQRLLWMQRPIRHLRENLPAVSCSRAALNIRVVVQFEVLHISMRQN